MSKACRWRQDAGKVNCPKGKRSRPGAYGACGDATSCISLSSLWRNKKPHRFPMSPGSVLVQLRGSRQSPASAGLVGKGAAAE